jgi:hypothetical protein
LVSFPRLGGIGRPEVFDLHLSRYHRFTKEVNNLD